MSECHRSLDLNFDSLPDCFEFFLCHEPFCKNFFLESFDRVVLSEALLHLFLGSVFLGVSNKVALYSVCLALDDGRSFAFSCSLNCFFGCFVNCKYVVSVAYYSGNSISYRTVGYVFYGCCCEVWSC